jgi:hypothetical protein
MWSGVTILLRLLDSEDAMVTIILNVDIVAVSGTSSLHPQRPRHVFELRGCVDSFYLTICTQIGLIVHYINV